MMGLPQKRAIEKLELILNCIDSMEKLDRFTFEQILKDSDHLEDESIMYMIKALAYGAYQDNENALSYFNIAMRYDNVNVAKNYITYLTRTLQFNLSYKESIDIANKYDNQYLTFMARNIAYSFADIKNSSLLAEKLVKLHPDADMTKHPYLDFSQPLAELEVFMKSGNISESDARWIVEKASEVAANKKIRCVSSEFYSSSDKNDFAIILCVTTSDPDILSDMDIEIACALAENSNFSEKNVTAWFRSNESEKNYAELLV
ncbi:hypothetical protein SGI36_19420 [Providencia rettgeri]|uniref:hypothetical protein n=1 Tax=Providencia TaxID=586 RepID=UPI001DF413E1|nr:hypothetical protein [Providencia rettgeri]ELH9583176.1 hypothetical protein [Providencia rettgeri]ELR5051878.1 hypothetical protein [Providencia rettgeri]ELR5157366.1 hypothetical protein [Providencia rettgeri]ELR5184286.1 hypothetical protein [Providencia rettgeri]